jgi:hypothetical protein
MIQNTEANRGSEARGLGILLIVGQKRGCLCLVPWHVLKLSAKDRERLEGIPTYSPLNRHRNERVGVGA